MEDFLMFISSVVEESGRTINKSACDQDSKLTVYSLKFKLGLRFDFQRKDGSQAFRQPGPDHPEVRYAFPVTSLMTNVFLNGHPVLQASSQRQFICIFQLTAKSNAPGNGGNADIVWLQLLLNIINGCIALYGRVQSKNELFCFFLFNSVQQ